MRRPKSLSDSLAFGLGVLLPEEDERIRHEVHRHKGVAQVIRIRSEYLRLDRAKARS